MTRDGAKMTFLLSVLFLVEHVSAWEYGAVRYLPLPATTQSLARDEVPHTLQVHLSMCGSDRMED
jgi:hypothetical protein